MRETVRVFRDVDWRQQTFDQVCYVPESFRGGELS